MWERWEDRKHEKGNRNCPVCESSPRICPECGKGFVHTDTAGEAYTDNDYRWLFDKQCDHCDYSHNGFDDLEDGENCS